MTQHTNNLAAFIWSLADLLRGDFKQSQYGRIILPFTLLRRLEGVVEDKKAAVLAQVDTVQAMNLPEETHTKNSCYARQVAYRFSTPQKWI